MRLSSLPIVDGANSVPERSTDSVARCDVIPGVPEGKLARAPRVITQRGTDRS